MRKIICLIIACVFLIGLMSVSATESSCVFGNLSDNILNEGHIIDGHFYYIASMPTHMEIVRIELNGENRTVLYAQPGAYLSNLLVNNDAIYFLESGERITRLLKNSGELDFIVVDEEIIDFALLDNGVISFSKTVHHKHNNSCETDCENLDSMRETYLFDNGIKTLISSEFETDEAPLGVMGFTASNIIMLSSTAQMWFWPASSRTVTSPYGKRSETSDHSGIDIGAGNSIIYASKYGTVTNVRYTSCTNTANSSSCSCGCGGFGNRFILDHGTGSTPRYSFYAHLAPGTVPEIGASFGQGYDTGGRIGNTGASQGAHLHFELSNNNSISGGRVNNNPYSSDNTHDTRTIAVNGGNITVQRGSSYPWQNYYISNRFSGGVNNYTLTTDTPPPEPPIPPLPSTSAYIPNGVYNIQHKTSGKYLTVENESIQNGAELCIWDLTDSGNRRFYFERLYDNTYKITSILSNKALTVYNASKENGANIIQYDWVDSPTRHWYIVDCGNGYFKFVNQNSGLNLCVLNDGTINGAKVIQWAGGEGEQTFRLIPPKPSTSANIENGLYQIQGKASEKFLTVENASKDNGAGLCVWENANEDNRKFYFERLSNNTYKITAKHSGKAIETANVSFYDGEAVQQWDYIPDYATKQWYVVDCGDGYYKFTNSNSGRNICIENNGIANGSKVIQWVDNGEDNQKFKLLRLPTKTNTTVTIQNGNYNFNIDVVNAPPTSTTIIATYDGNGRLAEMKTATVANIPVTMSKALGATNAKVMIWDGLNTMQPLCEPEYLTLN